MGTSDCGGNSSGRQINDELLEALNKVVRFEAQGEAAPVTEIALFGTNNDKLLVIKKQK